MSKGPFTRCSRAAVVITTSLVMVVAGAGMSSAYAAPAPPSAKSMPTMSNADHSKGNAGTSGTYNQVQPLSTADQNTGGANGQCPGGPYCSTRDGSASGNGNQTTGQHTGEPCAGCVGKADNKNPQGQMPNGSDNNAGYECDRNNGIGKTNPAHTGCQPGATAACVANGGGVTWTLTNSNAFLVTAHWVSGSQSGTVTIPAATTSGKTTTSGTATFTTSGDSVKITFPSNNFAEIDKTADCPPPPAPQQTLGAVIYLCNALTTKAPDAGADLAIEGTGFAAQSSMLAAQPVTAGDHTVDATAPTGYHFEDCAGAQHIVTPTTATETVNVPAGETGTAIFYVVQDTTQQPPTQRLGVNIFVCSTGTNSTGATFSATGAQTLTDQATPYGPHEVAAGDYTVTANPPSGFTLTDCGINGPVAPVSFNLPVGGLKIVNFYVAPVETGPGGGQTLAGVIYLCDSGHIVSGGSLSATGPQTLTDQANPFSTAVMAGDYTMTATPPVGFHLVVCNGLGTTGSQIVTVPANGSGIGRFYVAPDTTQTIAGVIYVCSTGMPASGGSLSATGPQTLTGEANPFGPTNVAAGDYTMTATAPTGFHLVVCNGQGSATTETVTVPAGGAGVGRFFVAPDVTPPTITQTLAGEILVCSSGQLVPGGSLTATGSNGTTTRSNPFGPQMVPAGSYTVSATAPNGFHLVVCNGLGSVGAQQVSVPAGGAGVATFFVAPTVPTKVLGERIPRTPTASTPATPTMPTTSPTVLPFTGSDVTALLPGGLGALLVGLLLLLTGRRRRTA